MIPPVVVVTNERDFAVDAVIAHLNSWSADVRRLNIEAATTEPLASWSPTTADSPAVVWWRQFELDESPRTVAAVDDLLVARAQWRVWLSTLDVPGSRWINPLWAARRAENKVTQLRTAARVGLKIPETIVTNDRRDAERLQAEVGEVVVKTLASAYFAFSDQSFVFTESLDHDALAHPDQWHAAPVVVQRRLVGAADARVVLIGEQAFAAASAPTALDWRKTPFEPENWQPVEIPVEVRRSCDRYKNTLELEYVAFDFMIDNGTWWFLEANQAGEFSFIDRSLDLGIAEAIAQRLLDLQQSVG